MPDDNYYSYEQCLRRAVRWWENPNSLIINGCKLPPPTPKPAKPRLVGLSTEPPKIPKRYATHYTLNGVTKPAGVWAKELDITKQTLRLRMRKWGAALALTTPRIESGCYHRDKPTLVDNV